MTNGFVHIVESPSDTDLLSGQTEGRSLCEALQLADIKSSYNLVVSRRTFESAIVHRLVEAHRKFNAPPILHLSMHGNNEGIGLTDGTFINWNELRPILMPLMNAMNGNLLICMSTCQGAFGQILAMDASLQTAPFWAIVGSNESVGWSESAISYSVFYSNFFRGIEVQDCVTRMRMATGNQSFLHFYGSDVHRGWIERTQRLNPQLNARLRDGIDGDAEPA